MKSRDSHSRQDALSRTLSRLCSPEASVSSGLRDIALLAAETLHAPISWLTIAQDDKLWIKSGLAATLGPVPLNETFCTKVLQNKTTLIVLNPAADEKFSKLPLVTSDKPIQFYLGVPLISARGHAIGTLCVMDYSTPEAAPASSAILKRLAQVATELLEKEALVELSRVEAASHQRVSKELSWMRKLYEENERLIAQMITKMSDYAIFSLDLKGVIQNWNLGANQIIGFSGPEVIGQHFSRLYDHPDQARHASDLQRAQRAGRTEFELPLNRKDDTKFWGHVVISSLRNDDGNLIGYSVVIQDLSEWKRTDDELRSSIERFQALAESLPQQLYMLAPNGFVDFANRRAREYFGDAKSGGAEAWSWMEKIHPEDKPTVEVIVKASRHHGSDYEFECRLQRASDQRYRWHLCRVVAQREADGQLLGWIGTNTDIQDLKEAERTIVEQQSKMMSSAKFSALGEMAASMAHEINNPLSVIHGRAGLLIEAASEGRLQPERVKSIAEKIEATALRIARIVKALRGFARDGGEDAMTIESVQGLVDSTLEFCRERFRTNGVEIRMKIPVASLTMECRVVQLSQVLLNLLNNAYDVAVESEEKWVEISAQESGDWVEVSVTDSGPGIPEEIRQKITQPFFTTKPVGKGTGLGLSVSRSIVSAHGGELVLDEASQRTRFVFRLPRRQAQLQQAG